MSEAVLPQVSQPVTTPTSDTLPIGAEFKDLSLKFFEKLAQEHYSNNPHADKVACEARMLLAKFTESFGKVLEVITSSTIKVVEITHISLDIQEDDTVLCHAVTMNIKKKFQEAAQLFRDASCFAEMREKISNFQTEIKREMKLIKDETCSIQKNQGYWYDGRDFIKGVEPFESSGHLSSLIKFFANPGFNFLILKGFKVCERKAAALQRQIDAKSADMDAVKEIKKRTDDAWSLLEKCGLAWTTIHAVIYRTLTDTGSIFNLLPTEKLTEATKDEITGELRAILKSLQNLYHDVADTIKIVDDCYVAHTMIQMNDAFQEAIKALSEALEQLLSAAKIVHGNHTDTLSDHVRNLAECFLKQFRYIEPAVDDWHAYVKCGFSGPLSPGFVANITSVTHNVEDFSRNTYVLCEKITLLASTKISMRRRMAAAGKRRKEEKELGADDPLNELTLATSAQVLEVIDKVQEAISKTFQFSLEFGLGNAYWSPQPEMNKTTQAGTADVNSKCHPLNPFIVDAELIIATAVTLKQQISHLERLVENQKGKANE